MLATSVIEEERTLPVPEYLRKQTADPCTVCLGESGVACPLEHVCDNFATVNSESSGFVTFSSRDLHQIYKGLRP